MRGGDSAAGRIVPDERPDARGDAFDLRGVCVFLTGGGTGGGTGAKRLEAEKTGLKRRRFARKR